MRRDEGTSQGSIWQAVEIAEVRRAQSWAIPGRAALLGLQIVKLWQNQCAEESSLLDTIPIWSIVRVLTRLICRGQVCARIGVGVLPTLLTIVTLWRRPASASPSTDSAAPKA